jgi:hypothetical protein
MKLLVVVKIINGANYDCTVELMVGIFMIGITLRSEGKTVVVILTLVINRAIGIIYIYLCFLSEKNLNEVWKQMLNSSWCGLLAALSLLLEARLVSSRNIMRFCLYNGS